MSATFICDFYIKSSPSVTILLKGAAKKYPAQAIISILKTKLRSTTITCNPSLNFNKKVMVTDLLQSKDKLYTKVYLDRLVYKIRTKY